MSVDKEKPDFVSRFRGLCKGADEIALSKAIGVSRNAFRQWKNSYCMPTVEKLVGIAGFFHVSTDYLLGLSDVKVRDERVETVTNFTGLSEIAVMQLKKGGEGLAKTINALLIAQSGRLFLAYMFFALHAARNGLGDDSTSVFKVNGDKLAIDPGLLAFTDPYEETQTYYLTYMMRAINNMIEGIKEEAGKSADEEL